MNARWNTSKSDTLADRLAKNPEEWQQYDEATQAVAARLITAAMCSIPRWFFALNMRESHAETTPFLPAVGDDSVR
jgi:hypothetical protein